MSTTPIQPRFLTVAEVAERIGMSQDTVRDAIRRGHLRAFQPGGRRGRLLIPLDAFADWVSKPALVEVEPTPSESGVLR